jgi:hypothetical protein
MSLITQDDPTKQPLTTAGTPASGPAYQEAAQNLSEEQTFFSFHDEEQDRLPVEDAGGLSTPFALPFQPSDPIKPVKPHQTAYEEGTVGAAPVASSHPGAKEKLGVPLWRMLLTVGIVVMTLLVGSLLVLAQTMTPPPLRVGKSTPTVMTTPGSSSVASSGSTPAPTRRATRPTPTRLLPDPQQTRANPLPVAIPSIQVLAQWGWTADGLTLADAIEAQRTASAFVEAEMSYDYRSLGTPDQHAGTLVSALPLFTKGGKVRFFRYDKREINNVLYNMITRSQLIQNALSRQITLVQFQNRRVQGKQHQFVWVTVAFDLHQSLLNAQTGKREDLPQSPSAAQIQQIQVLLMRVSPQEQGAGALLGGAGWQVNTYALATNALPPVATTPAL